MIPRALSVVANKSQLIKKLIFIRIWSNNMKEEYIGKFRGTPVIIKPDIEIAEIVLPESLATYILQLQDNKMEYLELMIHLLVLQEIFLMVLIK